ncbi:MAG: TetR/AcrR family transcriptional regulator [Deltaproteobacteria bacterium]|nr:TetR/AcrR family transcriptional regulator [Deltaproteobacteria bacterium]
MTNSDCDKRTVILDAALQLFSENGFHGTPMTLLAEKANVGIGTIYRYFKNKEEVISNLYKELKSESVAAMRENISRDMPIREQFINIFENMLKYYIANPQKFLFMEQYSYSPFINSSTKQEVCSAYAESLVSFFEYGKKHQVIKDLSTQIIFATANGQVVSLAKMHIAGEINLNDDMIRKAIETSWDALKR